MTLTLAFVPVAWEDYQHWQQTDKAILRRLNALLKELQRTPYEGIGKPESLRYERAGTWSGASPMNTGWCTESTATWSGFYNAATTTRPSDAGWYI